MPEETATGARFLRAILPASGGPGPTAGSVDPGLRIAFFRHFGPSRSEVQLHLVFDRTRGTVVPRRPKVHFMVGENTISFADVAPASVLAMAVIANPPKQNKQQAYILHTDIYIPVLILIVLLAHAAIGKVDPLRADFKYLPHGGVAHRVTRGYGEFLRNILHTAPSA